MITRFRCRREHRWEVWDALAVNMHRRFEAEL